MMSTKTCALLRHTHKGRDFIRWCRDAGDSLVASGNLFGGPGCAKRVRTIVAGERLVTSSIREVA